MAYAASPKLGRWIMVIFLLIVLRPTWVSASVEEIRSLLEFRRGIKSDPLNVVFSSWVLPGNVSACPETFHGVVCDPETESVVSISLDRLGLVGELKFSTLSQLKLLRNLTLAGNALRGRLVPSMRLMMSLEVIDLSGNQFFGPIPASFNDLWSLHYVNLSNNNLSGGFPEGIRNLQQLKVLDLHANRLQGDIRELIPQLRNVEYLDLSRNSFSGSMELSVEDVSSLANTVKYVDLSENDLGGRLWDSDGMKLFRNLKVLNLGYNKITGELPDFGHLPNLQVLRLRHNQFFGRLPLGLLQGDTPLLELDISDNGFSETLPEVILPTLVTLNLSSNSVSGSLPRSLGNCLVVDLSRNLLRGDLSALTDWNSYLEVLDLSYNGFTGNIPSLTHFPKLTQLSLRNNSLGGALTLTLGSLEKLSSIDLSSNIFHGPIPECFFTSMTIIYLNLSGNQLSGSIPLGNSHATELLALPPVPPMEFLDISRNALVGGLASEIGNWQRLRLLNLAKNRLSGLLPRELSKLTFLEYLDLSHNNFSGQIPERLPSTLSFLGMAYNNLSGKVPDILKGFPASSFSPGNDELELHRLSQTSDDGVSNRNLDAGYRHSSKSSITKAIIISCIATGLMVSFVLFAYNRARVHHFHLRRGFRGQDIDGDAKVVAFGRYSIFGFSSSGTEHPPTSLSFSNDHLLTSNSRSLSGPMDSGMEIVEHVLPSTVVGSPDFLGVEKPATFDVYSPDRLAGELLFLDTTLRFSVEELSHAPAEVLGRSSHGTLYKATLDNGQMLTVKWLRVGLVKNKKDFAKEVRKIGSVRHLNIVPLRAYYWGPSEQERLILSDYIFGDSLALHLYENTPRRHAPLSFIDRLRIAVDIARALSVLHDRGLPHGNLKPTNILLLGSGSGSGVRLSDYGLHRLMTPKGISEQILNMGALGYRAPELATATKPIPTLKSDVYALGVILMELLTRRSAGDIISGQSGAVDLTDWVRLCDQQGRGVDCFDRDMAGGGEEESSRAMNEMLTISLRCILPVSNRPSIRQVVDELSSIAL